NRSVDESGWGFFEAELSKTLVGIGGVCQDARQLAMDARAQETVVEHQTELEAVRMRTEDDRDDALGGVRAGPERARRHHRLGLQRPLDFARRSYTTQSCHAEFGSHNHARVRA